MHGFMQEARMWRQQHMVPAALLGGVHAVLNCNRGMGSFW